MKKICKATFVVCAIAMISACSSTGEIQTSTALTHQIDHSAVASLSAKPHAEVKPTPAVVEATTRLRGQLFGRLVSEGVFRQVVHEGEPSQYKVEASLLAASEVSQGARIFFGVFAGSNQLAVEVKVFDAAQGGLLTSFVAKGTSASHPLSSENDMDDAIREVVDEIILALQ